MQVDVSVVVPFYNVERYVQDCIHALLSQSYPADRYEIIMVDNNSTDRSAEIVERCSNVKCLSERKQGSYAARNRGVNEARGSIIAFTDPDCVPDVNWLQSITEAMLCPEVNIVLGQRRFATGPLILSLLAAYESEVAAYTFSSHRKEIYYGYTNNMAVRRSSFDSLGPFLEIDRGADNNFVRRAVDEYGCDAVLYSSEVCVRHLEIASVWDHFRKKHVYGRVSWENRKIGAPKPLAWTERLGLFKKVAREENCALAGSALFLLFLGIGMVCYELGRRQAIWNSRRGG